MRPMTARTSAAVMAATLLITLLASLAPPAAATTVASWGSTESPGLGTAQVVDNSVSYSPSGSSLLMVYDPSAAGASHPCNIAISNDGGVTWFPNKVTGQTSTGGGSTSFYNCDGDWLSDTSLVVQQDWGTVRVSTNSGTSFVSKDFTDTGSSAPAIGAEWRQTCLDVFDATHWMVVGLRTISADLKLRAAYTADGGTTWSFSTIASSQASIPNAFTTSCRGVLGITATTWAVQYVAGSGTMTFAYTTNAGASTTWNAQGTMDISPGQIAVYGNGLSSSGSDMCVGVLYNAANSLYGINQGDAGYNCKTLGGSTVTSTIIMQGGAASEIFNEIRQTQGYQGDKLFYLKQTNSAVTPQFIIAQVTAAGIGKARIQNLDANTNADLVIWNGGGGATSASSATGLSVSGVRGVGTAARAYVWTGARLSALAAPEAAGADATASITQLAAFRVAHGGAQIVTRENVANSVVKLYNGQSLVATGASASTACSFVDGGGYSGIAGASIIDSHDGVNAGSQLVSYYRCEPSGSEAVAGITVKKATSAAFSTPDFPGTCSGACYATINDEDLAGNDDVRRELGDLQSYPFDWSQHREDGLNRAFLTWAFATSGGDVGAVTLVQVNAATDLSNVATANVDASGSRDIHICTTRDSNTNSDYLYAVAAGTGGDVKGFRVKYTEISGTSLLAAHPGDLEVSLQLIFPGSQVANPSSIGCGESKLLTVGRSGGTGTVKLCTIGGAPCDTVATGSAIDYYSALSDDGLVGAYQDGNTIKVFRTDTRAVFDTFTLPSYSGSDPCGLYLSTVGATQSVYFGACGSAGKIFRFALLHSPYSSVVSNPDADTDGDGVPNAVDDDIDDDGLLNSVDPDIDGDGLCNSGVTTAKTAAEANPGRVGCNPGDTDSDGDGLPDSSDASPSGTATGPQSSGTDTATGGSTSNGLLGVSNNNVWYFSGAAILGFLMVGYRFTAGNRKRGDD